MKTYHNICFILVFFFLGSIKSYSAFDTLVYYNSLTDSLQYIPIQFSDTSASEEFIPGNIGTWKNVETLSLIQPSTLPGMTMSVIKPTIQAFDILKYPIRTAVKYYVFHDGDTIGSCSGALIGNKYILTAAHCMMTISDTGSSNRFWDSILVMPAFDMGIPNPQIGIIRSTKYYVFKETFQSVLGEQDIGIIELDSTIGDHIGWLGYGYKTDYNFFLSNNNIFYSFSYPAVWGYTGDTSFYKYGKFQGVGMGSYLDAGDTIIPGESGSNFFYTDNEKYLCYGVRVSFPGGYNTLTKKKFFAFKYLMEKNVGVNLISGEIPNKYQLYQNYPNPFNPTTTIRYAIPLKTFVAVKIYNILGEEVLIPVNKQQNAGIYEVEIDGTTLTSGVYFYTFRTENFADSKRMILVK